MRERFRGVTLGWLGAIIVVVLLGGCALVFVGTGGPPSDTKAVRGWLRAQGAPKRFADRVSVQSPCPPYEPENVANPPFDLVRCAFRGIDLRACFTIDDDGHANRGGWQLASIGGCRAVRYDRGAHALVDVETGARFLPE